MAFDFASKRYILAPLAGWTDLPFRQTVKKFGADLTVSEMVSANALVHNPERSFRLYEKSPLENPYSVQIAGSTVEIIRQAVEILNDHEGIDIIDLNAGCPAPKVVRGGSGSCLLKTPKLLHDLVSTIKKSSNKPMTSTKIRLGFNENNAIELAKACEDAGSDFIVVHGRTRAGAFLAPVDYEAIGKIKQTLKIPVIANGDIDSYEKAQKVFEITGADGVMIGRGAMGKPWIFEQLKRGSGVLDRELMRSVIVEHYDNTIEFHGKFGVPIFRKHLHRYSKGIEGATSFRDKINHESDPAVVRNMIIEFFS